jgi:SAM-dependent methyltransferase
MKRDTSVRPCPMCHSRHGTLRAAMNRRGTRFEIAECASCGFVYVLNPKGQTFEPVQQAPSEVPENARHRQIKRVCDQQFIRRSPSDRLYSIVEVGAGWGGLAQVFAHDARYRYLGLEPSAARATFCRERGLDVRQGFFDASVAGVADAVIFDNVLEHVVDPESLVRAAVSCLRDGGLLVVIVPNVRDVRQLNRSWRERHHWQPHCHINYFSARDLDRMFTRHGLSCRFFGFESLGGVSDDFELAPRVLTDAIGLHLFGLNCYGVKSVSQAVGS